MLSPVIGPITLMRCKEPKQTDVNNTRNKHKNRPVSDGAALLSFSGVLPLLSLPSLPSLSFASAKLPPTIEFARDSLPDRCLRNSCTFATTTAALFVKMRAKNAAPGKNTMKPRIMDCEKVKGTSKSVCAAVMSANMVSDTVSAALSIRSLNGASATCATNTMMFAQVAAVNALVRVLVNNSTEMRTTRRTSTINSLHTPR